jgi:outer membrane lipoprotein-sorting protein
MARRINVAGMVLVIVLASLVLGVNQGLSADWPSVFKEAKAKYAKFEKEIKDMTVVQQVKITTPKAETTSDMKMLRKGEKFRMEIKMQMPQTPEMPKGMGEMETVIIYNGEDMWMISSFLGKKKLSDKEAEQYKTEKNWWNLISEKAKIVGTEEVDKRECYVVETSEEKEFPFTRIWLDKETLNLIKGEHEEPKAETMLWVNSDFKKIKDDWEMPYKTEMYSGEKLMTTSTVKSIEVNQGLSDDLFDPDKVEVKKVDMQEMMKKMMQEEEEKEKKEEEGN